MKARIRNAEHTIVPLAQVCAIAFSPQADAEKEKQLSRSLRTAMFVFCCLFLSLPAGLRAQSDDFDQYKLRLDTYWFYSNPGGSVQGNSDEVPVDFQKDLGFNSYSTFAAKADWKFTRKNHFYVSLSRFNTTRQTLLDRTITFRGQTFEVGTSIRSDLHAFLVAPGYQYDIIRRKRGHLGIGVQVDMLNTSAKITGAPTEGGGVVSAKGSLLAPIPVAGPDYRIYLTDSPRVFSKATSTECISLAMAILCLRLTSLADAEQTHQSQCRIPTRVAPGG